jgi:hypothetical protein
MLPEARKKSNRSGMTIRTMEAASPSEVGSDEVRVVQRFSAVLNLELRHLKSRLGTKGDEVFSEPMHG